MIRFDATACRDLTQSLSKEWLETNGLGGFASSTIAGIHTRRYHGLLTAAVRPPAGRGLLLSKIEETLYLGDRSVDLSANRYPGVIHPQGYMYLQGFRLDPFPIWTFQVDGVELEKHVYLVHGEETVVVEYALTERSERPAGLRLELYPLVAFRDYHSLTHASSALDPRVEFGDGCASIQPYGELPRLHFAHDAASAEATGLWFYRFEYEMERARGLDFEEDLFNPLVLRFDLNERPTATIVASLEQRRASDATSLGESERKRRKAIADRAAPEDETGRLFALASDQFLVRRGDRKTVIAGYPWFADWGRDTMIALPGLTLAFGQDQTARDILVEFAQHVDQGMLPNRFPEQGEQREYNSVDAALWYFDAVAAYLEHSHDAGGVEAELYPALCSIVDWFERGTRYGIGADADGLLHAGAPGVQLTWMDAKAGDWVVTPRRGKPVEVQALWFNALRILGELARHFGDGKRQDRCAGLADRAQGSFNRLFWNEQRNCLFDVVDELNHDDSIRPNQVFAISLRHAVLDRTKWEPVLQTVERELLTPYGLRTLAPGDPGYCARYEGGVRSRDAAYHQGTVWPWLLGPYVAACLRVRGAAPADVLSALERHLRDAGLGQVPEIFDAEEPQRPRGCFAQAWSVAELVRARQMLAQSDASDAASNASSAKISG